MEEAVAVVGGRDLRGEESQGELRRETDDAGERAVQVGDRGDHGRELGPKKNVLGIEDHGQLPAELQQRVHQEVELTKERSGWPVAKTLTTLGVSVRSYYRWRRERSWERPRPAAKPVPPYEATAEEKRMVLEYARRHAALRHRELAWRMTDEGVAFLSPSTVYRILKAENLVCLWQ